MWVQFFIWTFFVHYGLSSFFNIPGSAHPKIYTEETHEDLLTQLAGKRSAVQTGEEFFNIENAVSSGITFGDMFPKVTITKDDSDNYILTASEDDEKPTIQALLNKMFHNYNLQTATTVLNGDEIQFEKGLVSNGGMITLTGRIKEVTLSEQEQIILKRIIVTLAWQDLLSEKKTLGEGENTFTMKNIAIGMKSEHKKIEEKDKNEEEEKKDNLNEDQNKHTNVRGEEIKVDIQKLQGEENRFTIKQYDALDTNGDINIFKFLKDFYSKIEPKDVATNFDGVNADKISKIDFTGKFTGFGHISVDGNYQLVIQSKGAVDSIEAFDGATADMKIIINRPAGKDVNIAFVGQFDNSKTKNGIKDVVSSVTSNRDEKYFNRIKNRDYCLTISRDEFDIIVSDVIIDRYKSSFEKCFPTEFEENTKDLPLKSGVAAIVEVSLKDDSDECLQKACDDDECKEQYEKTTMIGHLTATGITFSYTKSTKINMLAYLQCLGGDTTLFKDLPLSFINPDNERKFMSIYDFHQEIGHLSVTCRATFPEYRAGILFNMQIKTIDFTYEFTDNNNFGKEEEEESEEEEANDEEGDTEASDGEPASDDETGNRRNRRRRKNKPRTQNTNPKKQNTNPRKPNTNPRKQNNNPSKQNNNDGKPQESKPNDKTKEANKGADDKPQKQSNNSEEGENKKDSETDQEGEEDKEGEDNKKGDEDKEDEKNNEKEKSSFEHDVSITIDGVDGANNQRNFMCEGQYPFKEFECTMYIASMRLIDSLETLIGEDDVKAILENESLKSTNILYTGLKNIELKYSSGNNKKISFVSQISLGTYDGISTEILWYKTHGWAFGLSFEKLDVEYVIKLFLSPFNVEVSLPWLRNVDAYVVYSNIDLENVKKQEDGGDSGEKNEDNNDESKDENDVNSNDSKKKEDNNTQETETNNNKKEQPNTGKKTQPSKGKKKTPRKKRRRRRGKGNKPNRRDMLKYLRRKVRSSVPASRSSLNTQIESLQSYIHRATKRQSESVIKKSHIDDNFEREERVRRSAIYSRKNKPSYKNFKEREPKPKKNSKESNKNKKGKGKKNENKEKPEGSDKANNGVENKEEGNKEDKDEENKEDGEDDEEEDEDDKDNKEDDKYRFSLTSLKKETIQKGFRFLFTWKAPDYKKECYDDSICNFIVENMPGSTITIGGNYTAGTTWTLKLFAKLTGPIKLNDNGTLTFEDAQLQIGLSNDPEEIFVMISTTLKYLTKDLNLEFTGMVRAALSGKLELQFTMKGFIYKPLGIRYLAFGDLYLGARMSVEKGKFSITIEIGATIAFGKIIEEEDRKHRFDGEPIVATGFLGLNPINIVDSWIYAHLEKLTFGMIADVFNQKESFPEKFLEDGFHKGLLFSYSNQDITIDALSKEVSTGLHLAGGLKFAFFEAEGDFMMDYINGKFEITMDVEPISLMGGLVLFTSMDDPEKGPHFELKANIKKPADLEINVDAKLKLFGYGVGARIIINKNEIVIEVSIQLMFFEVGVKLELILGNTLPNRMPQQAKVCLYLQSEDENNSGDGKKSSKNFREKLTETITEFITGIKQDAKKVQKDQNLVEQQGMETTKTGDTRTNAWNKAIGGWDAAIKKKKTNLEEKVKQSAKAYTTCKENCGKNNKICVPFFVWEKECWKVWGYPIGCPKWNKCAFKITDPFCLLKCEVESLKNSFLEFVQGAINKIEKAVKVVVDGVSTLVTAFKEAVNLLKTALDNLRSFVADLVTAIIDFSLSILNISIKTLELEATFGQGFRLCFSYKYHIEAFGETFKSSPDGSKTTICLDEILQRIVKLIFGSSKKEEVQKHNEYYDNKDKAEGFIESAKEADEEVKKTDKKTDDEVKLETSKTVVEGLDENNELPTQGNFFKHVDEIKNQYYDKYSDEDLEVLNTPHHMKPYKKPAHVVKFMEEKAPWKMAQHTIDNPPNHLPEPVSNATAVKRSLILGDSKMSPCDRVKRSLHDYSTLTNGLMQSIMHMENGKIGMNAQRRSDVNKLAEFYAKTHKLGTEYTNYTPRQKRDIYYWYEQLKDGYQEHFRLTKRSFVEHQRDTLPKVKESLDDILGKHVGSSFESYTDELHRHAIDGFKRSNIPRPNDGEALLHGIKRNLTLIVTNEEFPLTHMKRHLNNVNQAIRAVNKQVMQC